MPPDPAAQLRVCAVAPMRLDLAGGWTDVAPFATTEGGVVVNAAIALYAKASVRCGTGNTRIESESGSVEHDGDKWEPTDSTAFDFQKAALRRFTLSGCTLRTGADTPAGSGLGGSGALGVAMIAALDAATGRHRTPGEIAEEAFAFEAIDAALPGGRQDQYGAAFGGFNQFTFRNGAVQRAALEIDPAFLVELRECLVICHTGASRVSARTIARVMQAYVTGVPAVVGALRTMVDLAYQMSEACRAGDLACVAAILSENWRAQQALDGQMQTPVMADLERLMYLRGALGGKAAGSGAGGSMFFVMKNAASARQARHDLGARVLPCNWDFTGVTVTTE